MSLDFIVNDARTSTINYLKYICKYFCRPWAIQLGWIFEIKFILFFIAQKRREV